MTPERKAELRELCARTVHSHHALADPDVTAQLLAVPELLDVLDAAEWTLDDEEEAHANTLRLLGLANARIAKLEGALREIAGLVLDPDVDRLTRAALGQEPISRAGVCWCGFAWVGAAEHEHLRADGDS